MGWPYRPQGLTAAQLNLPYCVATLLIAGDVFVEQFSETLVADPARIKLAERVAVRHDPQITARGAKFRHMVRVEVRLTDGSRHEQTVEAPRGSERNFAGEADVVAKFRKLAGRALPGAQINRLAELVRGCDKLPDVAPLVEALAVR